MLMRLAGAGITILFLILGECGDPASWFARLFRQNITVKSQSIELGKLIDM